MDTRTRPAQFPSVCPHDCQSVCALKVEVDTGPDGLARIGRVHGGDQPYTDGVVCAKVARYAERVHHPDRLTTPLRRTGAKGSGQFEPLSWDAALDLVAENFSRAIARHGAETVWPYHYAGTMGFVQRGAIRRLANVGGFSQQLETFCVALSDAGWLAGTGEKRGTDARELVESDLIVIWGGNPVHTQVNLMSWVQKARRGRDAPLVVIDPYRTPTAAKADIHLALRPGTDGALACAVMHVLLVEGLADRDYMARLTDFSPEVEAHLAARTPEGAANITGLTVEEIVGFACLPAVTGAWQHRGGGALVGNGGIYKLNTRFLWGVDAGVAQARFLDMGRIGAVLAGEPRDIGNGPPVTAMLIQSTNPAVVAPESLKVRRGFMREDLFTCVHEQFLTDTAKLADVVLPATTFLEHDDLYQASAHTYLQTSRALIPPIGQSRSNQWCVSQIAARLGIGHPAFGMDDWSLVQRVLTDSGRTGNGAFEEDAWLDCALPFEEAHFLNGFATPDRKFHFCPDWSRVGPNHASMPRFPDHQDINNACTPELPYRLVAAPARNFLNTSFTEMPSSRAAEKRPTAMLHPDTAGQLGIQDQDLVRLGNGLGSVVVHAKLFDGLQPSTVVVESQWPNDSFIEGIGINALVSAEPGLPAAGAAYHDTAIWIRKEPANAASDRESANLSAASYSA